MPLLDECEGSAPTKTVVVRDPNKAKRRKRQYENKAEFNDNDCASLMMMKFIFVRTTFSTRGLDFSETFL